MLLVTGAGGRRPVRRCLVTRTVPRERLRVLSTRTSHLRRQDFDDPGVQSLYVGGTSGLDVISVIRTSGNQVMLWEVWLNGQPVNRVSFVNGVTGKIVMYGQDGNDVLSAAMVADRVVHLYGQGGDDELGGGQLADLLVGGPGNDLLMGNAGPDRMRVVT